jgi:hypothetical protein
MRRCSAPLSFTQHFTTTIDDAFRYFQKIIDDHNHENALFCLSDDYQRIKRTNIFEIFPFVY